MKLLEGVDLSKHYRLGHDHQIWGVREVSLSVRQGDWLVISGPSGSGKSTLLALLAALDRPTSGQVFYKGEDLSRANDVRLANYRKEEIGIVFQEYHLFEELTALENIGLPLVAGPMTAKQRTAKAMELLERVGLAERASHLPRQLSGGERQRVALARALVRSPQLIFADEPTSNIDQKTSAMVLALLRELNNQGHTLVVISHSPEMIGAASQRLGLENGSIAG
ncbi:MAG: ABC transporter ATP-binding protein [Thermodesulfobacteriota bacterium]